MTITDLHHYLAPRIFVMVDSFHRFFILPNVSSRSLSKFKFFASLLCIICQNIVIISCARPSLFVETFDVFQNIVQFFSTNRA